MKVFIPFNNIDIYARLRVLLSLSVSRLRGTMSGHSDTLTEGSKLIDQIYKSDEVENEQQYRKSPDKFHTK